MTKQTAQFLLNILSSVNFNPMAENSEIVWNNAIQAKQELLLIVNQQTPLMEVKKDIKDTVNKVVDKVKKD